MKSQALPIATGCTDCSRRAVLRGIGAAAVGALLLDAGCSSSGSSQGTAKTTTCGAGQCIDLADPANQALAAVGGALLLDTETDTVMVIRLSDTQVAAVSAICTHAGCGLEYNASQQQLDCGCHGSQFSTTGGVLRGPANRAVKAYTATLASNVITIA
jgi:cytochrome b6-f complex iron-sulfur subunit